MAIGASGVATFTSGNKTLRIYWQQEYTAGGTGSIVNITKCTIQATTSYSGSFFMDGYIKINGVTAIHCYFSSVASHPSTAIDTSERTLNGMTGSVTVDQSTGSAVDVNITTHCYKQSSWGFLFWNSSVSDYSFNFANNSAQSISLNAIPQSRTLTISQATGSTVSVTRNGTALAGGATITDGDQLVITGTANTGYSLSSLKVNGSAFTSGNTYTVSGDVTVATTASLKTYTLTISQATGSTVTVKKGTTALASGATVTHGDTLTVTATANTGYNLGSLKVNGSTFSSGSTHTVSGAVTVATTASVKSFTLTVSQGAGTTVTVKRTASPKAGAATGSLSSGATVYYSDTLQISASAGSGYEVTALTVNGSSISSGGTHTVTAAVAVVSAAKQLGLAYIGADAYLPYVCIDGAYVRCQPYIGAADGSSWILQS